MTNFNIFPLSNIWQFQRKEILEKFVSSKRDEIWKIYVATGHLFVALNNGHQLLTFDVKPSGLIKDAGDLGCLDLLRLQHRLLEISFLKSHQLAFVVQENGHIHIWKYDRANHLWMSRHESDLCNVSHSKVTSVCLSGMDILWCEERSSVSGSTCFCVCKRSILIGVGSSMKLGPVVALLHNCPPSDLFAINDTLLIFPRIQTSTLTCVRIQLKKKNVDVFSGDVCVPYAGQSKWQSLDFGTVALSCLPSLYRVCEKNAPVVAAMFDSQRSCVIGVNEEGYISLYMDDDNKLKESGKKIHLEAFVHDADTRYSVCNGLIMAAKKKQITFYNKITGRMLHRMSRDVRIKVAEQVTSCPTLFPVIFDKNCIYFVQKCARKLTDQDEKIRLSVREMLQPRLPCYTHQQHVEAVCKSFILGEQTSEHHLRDRKKFHNPALVLTILDQMVEKDNSPELSSIRKSAINIYAKVGRRSVTDFDKLVEPYLKEYLMLEKVWNETFDASSNISVHTAASQATLESDITRLIQPNNSVSIVTRQAQLEDYASLYPQRVLVILMKLMDSADEELTNEHLEKWSHVLTGGRNTSVKRIVDFPLYDIICRLMFRVMPNQLVKFVGIAQSVSDTLVDVPAFVRKTQMLLFYERALSCIPEPERSCNQRDAAIATARLMLTLDGKMYVNHVMSMLLRCKLWDSAVAILQRYCDDTLRHVELFHRIVAAMAQNEVLTDYADSLSQLQPKQLTLTSLLTLMTCGVCDEQNEEEVAVMCSSREHIRIEQLRPVLLQLANKSYMNG